MPTIIKRGNSYSIVVCNGYRNGKKVRQTVTYRPPHGLTARREKANVEEFARDFERRVKGGYSVKYDKLSFKEYIDNIYIPNYLNSLKPKTQAVTLKVINTRLIPYFGNMLLRNITHCDVNNWYRQLKRTNNPNESLSPATKNNYLRTFSSVLGAAVKLSIIEKNPAENIRKDSEGKPEVKCLSYEDVQKINLALKTYNDKRASTFITLALSTGMRLGEMAGLEWQDIDFNNGVISVVRTSQYISGKGMQTGTPKSTSGIRTIPLTSTLASCLKSYKEYQMNQIESMGPFWIGPTDGSLRLFTSEIGNPIYDSTLRKWLNKFLASLGIDRVTIHGLRHTFASLAITKSGNDARTIASILGHSTPSLVYNTYANEQESAKVSAMQSMEFLFGSE